MDMVGDRKFVDVPGGKTHELPPLVVNSVPEVKRLDKIMNIANRIIEQEDMVPCIAGDRLIDEELVERRKMDLALNLVDRYLGLLSHWQWGDAVVEWIRQCEITFGARLELRNLLRNDLWPHAGRSSFVTLLEDKGVGTEGVEIEKAVGMRLAFREMPSIRCCTDQFLLYLNGPLFSGAYRAWAEKTPAPLSAFPPERFQFQVVKSSCLH